MMVLFMFKWFSWLVEQLCSYMDEKTKWRKVTMVTPLQLWIIRWCDFKICSNAHRKRLVSESQQSTRWQPLELVFLKFDWFCIPSLGAVTVSILGILWNNLGISITSWRWGRWATGRALHGTTDSNGLWGTECLEIGLSRVFQTAELVEGPENQDLPAPLQAWLWSPSFFWRWKSWLATKEVAGPNIDRWMVAQKYKRTLVKNACP